MFSETVHRQILQILRCLNAELLKDCRAKAEAAYPVLVPLERAIEQFQQNPDYQQRCFEALRVKNWQQVIDGVELLQTDIR